MRMTGQLAIFIDGQQLLRDPTFWERVKKGLGARIDLDSGKVQNSLEASLVIDVFRRAIAKLGVSNALALVIDETVIFQDSDGKADDLPDLVLAFSEHASVFGKGFEELKLAAEHREAGLHLVIEARARTVHKKTEPAAIVTVSARIAELEPKAGESAESYRTRVEPLTADRALFETARLQFDNFAHRLESTLKAYMPEARVEAREVGAKLVKANAGGGKETAIANNPSHPAYDPYLSYYASPMGSMLDVMLISSFMHMAMPPTVMVMHPSGASLGSMDEVAQNPELVADDVVDPGVQDDVDSVSGGDTDSGFDDPASDGFDSGGDDQGGDFDSGGFDGGDFGGSD
ncbi:MAG: hypothetical protein SGI86_05895 [Deltaproteobacteria bacterium]|nr:hypothetical protein [Deltaproteobacteria bacterium]